MSESFFRVSLSKTILIFAGVSFSCGVTSTICPVILQPFVARPGGFECRSSVVVARTWSPTWAFLASTAVSSCARINRSRSRRCSGRRRLRRSRGLREREARQTRSRNQTQYRFHHRCLLFGSGTAAIFHAIPGRVNVLYGGLSAGLPRPVLVRRTSIAKTRHPRTVRFTL